MTNITPQEFLNKGYEFLAASNINIDTTAVQIPAVANTSLIRIINNLDTSGGGRLYIGGASVTTSDGFPLFYLNSASTTVRAFELVIPTTKPESFYLISNISGNRARVLYLKLIV